MSAYGIDTSLAPFYDKTEREVAAGYISILARPGFVFQASEANILQGLLEKAVKDVGDIVAKDGTIIDGIELRIYLDGSIWKLDSTVGHVYINGRKWFVPAVSAVELGSGDREDLPDINVDVVLTGTVVTEVEDPYLLSPAQGFSNFGQPGAHRRKVEASLELNSVSGTTIYKLVQGFPLKLPATGALSEVESTLARRTYHVSDHFLVTGMSIIEDGEDEVSFAEQPQIKPVSGYGGGSITPGQTSPPYGPTWTNHVVITGATLSADDIGRRLVISAPNSSPDYTGTYVITDVISSTEMVVDAQFDDGAAPSIQWVIKDAPENLFFVVTAGTTYVLGYEILKPVSTRLQVPKATEGRLTSNEQHTVAFRRSEDALFEQPFNGLSTFAGEGLNTEVFFGMGMLVTPVSNPEAGWGVTSPNTPAPTRGGTPSDNLQPLTPYSGSLVDIVAVASSDGTWNWRLDPADPQYPGFFSGATYTYSQSGVAGWTKVGNTLVWAGTSPNQQPSVGTSYKVMAVVTYTFQNGVDFKVRSNATPRIYPQAGTTTSPGTSNALFFPQTSFSIAPAYRYLTLEVDGFTVPVDFADPDLVVQGILGSNNLPGSAQVFTLAQLVNTINYVAYQATGIADVATLQLHAGTAYGWLVLQSPNPGGSIAIPAGGGNDFLGFPDGLSSDGQTSPQHVVVLGGFKLPSLMARGTYGSGSFDIDYYRGLYRRDVIVLDKDGVLTRLEGDSDIREKVKAPSGFMNTLSLGMIELTPNSTESTVTNFNLERLTQPQLRNLSDRVANVEYNLGIYGLDKDSIDNSGINPLDLRGVMSDGFIGFSKADVTFNEGGVDYSVALDVIGKQILLASSEIETDLLNTVGINTGASTADLSNVSLITQPTIPDTVVLSQTAGTEFILLNQLGSYTRQPRIRLNPFFDNYVDNDPDLFPVIQNIPVRHRLVDSWVEGRVTRDAAELGSKAFNIQSGNFQNPQNALSTDSVVVDTSEAVLNESRLFLRRRWITIYGENFGNLETGIVLKFDGREITTLPNFSVATDFVVQSGTDLGLGVFQALADGTFRVKIRIPKGIYKRRVHVITAQGTSSVAALSTFRTWFGRKLQTEDAYFTGGQGYLPRKPANETSFAPVAQTFSLPRDILLNALTLYFGGSDNSSINSIVLQIRNVTNGLPGDVAYAEETFTVAPAYVDAVTGNIAFKVEFKDPVFISANQEYAIVLFTHSANYKLTVARVGSLDLVDSTKVVSQQPLSVGKLFTSSNNAAWVAQDDVDLKFKLHAANFMTAVPAYLVFNSLSVPGLFSRFLLTAESSAMTGSVVTWLYSTDGGSTYFPFTPNAITEVGSLASALIIKVVFQTTDALSTGIVLKDPITVLTRRLEAEGNYISLMVDTSPDGYSVVKQSLKVNLGASGVVDPYFGYRDSLGVTQWIKSELDGTRPPVTLPDGFVHQFYSTEVTLPGPDHTSPAKMVGTTTPSITNPTFNTVPDTSLTLNVTYWDAFEVGAYPAPVKQVSVPVTLTSSTTLSASQVVSEINAAAVAAATGLNIDLSAFASLDSFKRIVLTHPQSGGPLRNSIEVTNANAPLGFALGFEYGGGITAAASTGGSIPDNQDYFYIITGVLGVIPGENQDQIVDVDTIPVTLGVGEDAVILTFASDCLHPATEKLNIYRANSGSPSNPPGQSLASWSLIDTLTLGSPGVPPATYTDTAATGSASARPPGTTPAVLPLNDFRARVYLKTNVPHDTPRVKDLSSLFVRE